MSPIERANKVREIYTSLDKSINQIGGELDMTQAYIDGEPKCGTIACHGGWLAHYFQTEIDKAGDRLFRDGIAALMRYLDFQSFNELVTYIEPYWHNCEVHNIFYENDSAFNDDGTTTFTDVKNYMISAFNKAARRDNEP